jgi:hypothetical protein
MMTNLFERDAVEEVIAGVDKLQPDDGAKLARDKPLRKSWQLD